MDCEATSIRMYHLFDITLFYINYLVVASIFMPWYNCDIKSTSIYQKFILWY